MIWFLTYILLSILIAAIAYRYNEKYVKNGQPEEASVFWGIFWLFVLPPCLIAILAAIIVKWVKSLKFIDKFIDFIHRVK